ncbi:MAG: hypothetical protein AB7U23_03110 [Dehalococcoidia bacterium]
MGIGMSPLYVFFAWLSFGLWRGQRRARSAAAILTALFAGALLMGLYAVMVVSRSGMLDTDYLDPGKLPTLPSNPTVTPTSTPDPRDSPRLEDDLARTLVLFQTDLEPGWVLATRFRGFADLISVGFRYDRLPPGDKTPLADCAAFAPEPTGVAWSAVASPPAAPTEGWTCSSRHQQLSELVVVFGSPDDAVAAALDWSGFPSCFVGRINSAEVASPDGSTRFSAARLEASPIHIQTVSGTSWRVWYHTTSGGVETDNVIDIVYAIRGRVLIRIWAHAAIDAQSPEPWDATLLNEVVTVASAKVPETQ